MKKDNLVKSFEVDSLKVYVFRDRSSLGKQAASDFSEKMKSLGKKVSEIRMIFAAAPSQNEFLQELILMPDLPWKKVIAFHMDEYLELDKEDPRLFQYFLKERLFSKVRMKKVHFIDPFHGIEQGILKYNRFLEKDIHMVALGIGENGHIAFNDPSVADFKDPEVLKVVELEERCKQQQVNDGAFSSIDEVPKTAVTITIPALMKGKSLFCIVPGEAKSRAVELALKGPVSESCPASILRTHADASLYLDMDSAREII